MKNKVEDSEPSLINDLLYNVMYGNLNKSRELISKRPNLICLSGEVEDRKKRKFTGTAIECASAILDPVMCSMLIEESKIEPQDALKQITIGMSPESRYFKEIHTNIKCLFDVYSDESSLIESGNYSSSVKQSFIKIKSIGEIQRGLPAHVLHEFCKPKAIEEIALSKLGESYCLSKGAIYMEYGWINFSSLLKRDQSFFAELLRKNDENMRKIVLQLQEHKSILRPIVKF